MAERTEKSSASSEKKTYRSWASERLLGIYGDSLSEELLEQANDFLRKRKVLDFTTQTGRVSARVHDDESGSCNVEVSFPLLSEDQWEHILNTMAQKALFLAVMFAGRFPPELEAVFAEVEAPLLPESFSDVSLSINQSPADPENPIVAAILLRLCERLDTDPFCLFVLRGRGREETILEVRKRRSIIQQQTEGATSFGGQCVFYEPAPPLVKTLDYFWNSGNKLENLSYNIRADELPASILRWLDPLPLGGLEDEVDYLFEEAYEKITRLAQSFGFRL